MQKTENHFTAKILKKHARSRIVQIDSKYRPEETQQRKGDGSSKKTQKPHGLCRGGGVGELAGGWVR
jgi:hypothetical protein